MRRTLPVAVLVTLVAGPLLPPGPASAAPTLSVSVASGGAPGDPTLLSSTTGRRLPVVVGASETATDVTVTPSGDGLAFDRPAYTYPAVAGTVGFPLVVTATTPGFHTLTLTVTADGAAPVTTTLDRLWAPGPTHLPATGSLAGQTWGGQGADPPSRFLHGNMLTFLDATRVTIGNFRGKPGSCDTFEWETENACVTYAYDAATGLIELGDAIGIVRPEGISFSGVSSDGFGGSDDFFSRFTFDTRLAPVKAGRRYHATWRFVTYDGKRPRSVKKAGLTFRRNGSFEQRYDRAVIRRGSYEIKRNGTVVLTGRFGTDRRTFLAVVGPGGADAKRYGAWLTFFVDNGRTSYDDSSKLVVE